ncbi:MAG: hypothetical protein AAGK17_00105 [Pseudomonadota bacterium]
MTARIVQLTCTLDCTPDNAWEHVQTSALLHHITQPLIRFRPQGQPFPAIWEPGEYRAWMFLFGFIPLGWQAIAISKPKSDGKARFVRDNGYSPLIKTWDHWIMIEPSADGEKTRYTDKVTIDAGVLTPVVALFARIFYGHRQKRWRSLARSRFAALAT